MNVETKDEESFVIFQVSERQDGLFFLSEVWTDPVVWWSKIDAEGGVSE